MGRAIFSIVSMIALAVIIVTNIDNRTAFNLFGWQFENLAVPVLALVSFVSGALYAFFFYSMGAFSKARRERLAMQKQRIKSQEQTIKEKNAELRRDSRIQATPLAREPQQALPGPEGGKAATPPTGKATGPGGKRRGGDGWFKRLFGASSK
ncbi:MAG: LapA family protein [Spirochaetales bacterium]